MIYKFRDTTAINTSLQTEEGSLVTIENPDEVIDLKSLEVDLEPIQDLNGYNAPWVGGAGKNKLLNNARSKTQDGITFTVNSDGTVKVNGTATAVVTLTQSNPFLKAGSYILSGCPSGGGSSTYEILLNTGSGTIYRDYGSGKAFTLTNDTTLANWQIVVRSGVTVNNLVFKPMVEQGSTATDYEPYSNICPISGHDSVETWRSGRNLLDTSYGFDSRTTNGVTFTVNADKSITVNGTATATAYFNLTFKGAFGASKPMPQLAGKTVTVKCKNALANPRINIDCFKADGTTGGIFSLANDNAVTRTIPFNFYSFRAYIAVTAGETVDNVTLYPQIELGTEVAEYEPYKGNAYTTALGRTVYGGTLDVTSGVLTVTHLLADLGSLSWTLYDNKRWLNGSYRSEIKMPEATEVANCLSDRFAIYSQSEMATDENILGLYVAVNGNILIRNGSTTDKPTGQLVYELATPQTYQLTAQQIDLLAGDNNIWSSGGSVTVTYAIDPELYNGMPTEAVSINGRFLEKMIEGYRTLYTSGRESLEVELGTYGVGTADGEKIKNRRYPSRVLTVGFQLLSDTPEEFRQRFNQLNNILSVEQADFIFADETDKFFTGTPIMDASVEAGQMNVTGEWKIYCGYPFKRSVQPITLTSTTDATISGNTATFNFNYKGVMPSKPLLRCEFASAKSGGDYTEDGDCGFVAFLNADESIIQLGNPEVIDVDATNKNEALINSEFDAFTGWTNSGKTIRSISDPYWNNGAGQTQNYASGTGTLTRSIASTIGFELDMVHRLSVSSPTQTGTFKTLLKNGNTTVVGFSIEKTGSGTAGTVKYIINNKVVGTDSIDISYYNTNFGYCNRTPVYVTEYYQTAVVTYVKKKKKKKKKKTTWVTNTRQVQTGWNYTQSNLNSGISRDGGVVTFSIGELPDRTFKDSDIATTACTSISVESTGTFDTNAVRSVALIQKAGVPFAEIPNVFTAGDIVEADCSDANVYLYRDGSLIGHLEPQYGALGNDWEDFDIKVGQNIIRAVWSDWVNTNYKPTIKIIFNKVYI